jgi:hypothetical protein
MKLNLRDLFWLTTIFAIGLGWSLDHRRQSADILRLELDSHRQPMSAVRLEQYFPEREKELAADLLDVGVVELAEDR